MADTETMSVMLLAALPVLVGEVAGFAVAWASKRLVASSLFGAMTRIAVGAVVFTLGHKWLSGLIELHSIALISAFSFYLAIRLTSDLRTYARRRVAEITRVLEVS